MAMRRLLIALATALAMLGLKPAEARPVGELDIGISQFPETLHPSLGASVAASYVLGMVRRPLTVYDARWRLVCMLCEELPTIENGLAAPIDLPDGKRGIRLTYRLHPAARWGDGRPITVEDVLFTYEVGRNARSGIVDAELYRRIIRIETQDSRTFTLVMSKLSFDYAALNDFEILPAHIERAAFADPTLYRYRTRYVTEPTNPGLYMGPYRVAEIAAGSHIVLERNPQWWGERPAFDRVIIWTVENSAALEANLLAGGLDMVAGELGFSLAQGLAFERRHGDAFTILFRPSLSYEHIDLALGNPILRDRRVRQALLYGIDRAAISRRLFAGRQPVADSFVSPLDWVFTTDVPRYPFEPARARELLDEAGWHGTEGSIRRNAQGDKLTLTLSSTSGNRSREMVEEVLQSEWRQIGVEVHIKNQPARVLFGDTIRHRKFQMALFGWASAPENVPRSILRSDEIPTHANNYAGQNYTGFVNAEADRLVDAIEIELDRDRRAQLWHELEALYARELPVLPLFFRADAYILPKWLKGVTPTGHQAPSTLWIEHWRRVDGAEQG